MTTRWQPKQRDEKIRIIWIILISGLIIYYQLIPDIISSIIAGIIIAGLTYLAIFGINVWRRKNEIQKLKDEKKES